LDDRTDEKPFNAHMADQAERKSDNQARSNTGTESNAERQNQRDTQTADKAVPQRNEQNESELDAAEGGEATASPAADSSGSEASEKSEEASSVAGTAETAANPPANQAAVLPTDVSTETGVAASEIGPGKSATAANDGVNAVPVNGGVLAKNRQADTVPLTGTDTEAEGLSVSGKPLPSVTAPAAVDATAAVQATATPAVATSGVQTNAVAASAQQNTAVGGSGPAEDAPLSQLSSELGGESVGAKESSRPALAVTTQLSMAAAKTAAVSETTLLAQAVSNTVDKVVVPASLVEKADQNLIKPMAAPRLIAPTVAKYQLEGQPSVTQTRVNVPVGQPQWPSAVAERVMWMSSQRVTSAEIHLDPPELGPLQVRVTVNQEAASVTFSSQHAAVREALDLGAFRLREMFEAQGMDLANVDVSDQSLAQGSEDGGAAGSGQGGSGGGAEEGEEVATVSAISSHDGLVDHYV
jgi:flagellar hook-length control protein FliK